MEKMSLLSGEDKAPGTFYFLLLDIVKLEPGLWATELTHLRFVVIRNGPNTFSCQGFVDRQRPPESHFGLSLKNRTACERIAQR